MDTIEQAVNALRDGNLVVFPTETVYGIAADAQQPSAMNKLYTAKGRDADKPIAYFIDHLDQLLNLIPTLPPRAKQLAQQFWPGPLTLVLPDNHGGYTGFRMPNHPIPLAILREFNGILAVTSANLSNHPEATTAQQAKQIFGDQVAVYLEGNQTPATLPSTVIRIDSENTPSILRKGERASEMQALWLNEPSSKAKCN